MGLIADEMKKVIEEQKLSYIATASKSGKPNVYPKGSIVSINKNSIEFAAVRSENIT